MKSHLLKMFLLAAAAQAFQCSTPEQTTEVATAPSQAELVARGKYLTTIGGCNDCHSPKVMTEFGPVADTTRLLSGHPKDQPIGKVLKTQDWVLFNFSSTASAGPWGVSFAANLTPDDTGIGNWNLEQFQNAIRRGKYKGLENSRTLLPPMPWQQYSHMTDEDVKAIFTYLKSLKPVNNLVPAPIPPQQL